MNSFFKTAILIARERRSLLFLLILVLIFLGLNLSMPLLIRKSKFEYAEFSREIQNYLTADSQVISKIKPTDLPVLDINLISANDLIRFGLPKPVAERWIKYREAIGGFATIDQVANIYGLDQQWYKENANRLQVVRKNLQQSSDKNEWSPRVMFQFDPNLVTEAELKVLGFSPKSIQALLLYRNKGKSFYRKEEIQYLAGVGPEFFEKVSKYIEIDTALIPPIVKEEVKALAPVALPAMEIEDRPVIVDINNSNAYEWQMLKGIGVKYAARIIRFRETLGGFSSIDQVSETLHLPDSVFQSIKPFLTFSPITQFLDINRLPADSLRMHPYINWKQASIIVNYRTQHGPYLEAEDLLKTKVFDEAFVAKIGPYLRF